MGCSITCTTAAKQANGHVLITFSDGSQTEYASLADAYQATYDLDSDPSHAMKWLVAGWLRSDPGANNPATYINGKTCTLNVGASTQIAVV